jgi:hypothetical protein
MTGTATFTHDFPDGPEILSPDAGSRVPPDQVVGEWAPVYTPAGINIAGYQVLVVQEQPPQRIFSADLPPRRRDCPSPPSPSNRALSTRLRCWRSRPAETKPSPNSPSGADEPPGETAQPSDGETRLDTKMSRRLA